MRLAEEPPQVVCCFVSCWTFSVWKRPQSGPDKPEVLVSGPQMDTAAASSLCGLQDQSWPLLFRVWMKGRTATYGSITPADQ